MGPQDAAGVLTLIRRLNPDDDLAQLPMVSPNRQWGGYALGSGFLCRTNRSCITAAHCIPAGATADQLTFSVVTADYVSHSQGESIIAHPTADIAVIRMKESIDGSPLPIAADRPAPGDQFQARGFTEDVSDPEEPKAFAGRVFAGHYQRFFSHRSFLGYHYAAAEMSIACPAGLSGGPLYAPNAPYAVSAVATEHVERESASSLDSIEVVDRDGVTVRTNYRRVVGYGVAILLPPLGEWLEGALGV